MGSSLSPSGMFKGTPQESNSTTSIPSWLAGPSKRLVGRAESISKRPYEAYRGQLVAGFNPDQLNTFSRIRGAQDQWRPYMDRASKAMGKAEADIDVKRWMNPYTTNVLNIAARDVGKQYDKRARGLRDSFITRSAFGGRRAQLAEKDLSDSYLQGLGDLYGRGRAESYDKALSSGFQERESQRAIAQALMAMAQGGEQMFGEDIRRMLQIGGMQQQHAQQGLTSKYQQWLEKRDWDKHQLDILMRAIGTVPYGTTTTAGASGGDPSMFSQVAGLAATGAAAMSSKKVKENKRPFQFEQGSPTGVGGEARRRKIDDIEMEMVSGTYQQKPPQPNNDDGILKAWSSKQSKTNKRKPGGSALAMLDQMPVEKWNYTFDPMKRPHVGPYAEDFKRATGLGDGTSIPLQDLIGVNMAGLKELDDKVNRMNRRA